MSRSKRISRTPTFKVFKGGGLEKGKLMVGGGLEVSYLGRKK